MDYGRWTKADLIAALRRVTEALKGRDAEHAAELAKLREERDTALDATTDDRIEDLQERLDDAEEELRTKEATIKSLQQQVESLEEDLEEAETRASAAEETREETDSALWGAAETVYDAAQALLPLGYEPPDEPLHVYDFRRALDDLRRALDNA